MNEERWDWEEHIVKIGQTEKKRWLEVLLLVFFFSVMSVQYLPRLFHEATGILFGAAAALHIYWNRRWFGSLSRGSWTPARLLVTVASLLLMLAFFVVLLTGLPISNELFSAVLPLSWRRNIMLHELHRSVPFFMLLLLGLHAGFHMQAWKTYLRECSGRLLSRLRGRMGAWGKGISVAAGVLGIVLFGVYGSFQLRVGDHLLLRHIFATDAMQGSGLRYAALLFGVFFLYAVGSALLFRLLTQRA